MKKIIVILGILLIFSTKAKCSDFPYDSIFNIKLGMTRDEVKSHLDSLEIKWEERKNDEGGKDISVDFVLDEQTKRPTLFGGQIQDITVEFDNKKINKIRFRIENKTKGTTERKMKDMCNCYYVTDTKVDTFMFLFDSCDIELVYFMNLLKIHQKSEKYKCKE